VRQIGNKFLTTKADQWQ